MPIALLLFWFILSAQTSLFFIIMGLLSSILIIAVGNKIFNYYEFRISWGWLTFILLLAREMFFSALSMIKIIWGNKQIETIYKWIEVPNDFTKIIYTNSITLTPGTMSMHLKDNKVLVHAISAKAMQDLNPLKNIILSNIK